MGMTNAERQRRSRERRAAGEPVRTFQRPKDRRPRPKRWADAVDQLRTLQAEYEAWRDQLPESMADSRTAELLEGVCAVGGTAGDPAASLKPGRRFPRGKGTDQIRAELHCKGLGGAGRRARRRTAARTGLGAPRAREPRGWSVPWNSLQRPSAELQRWR